MKYRICRSNELTVVDAEGRFRFSSLPEGVYHISLAAEFDTSEWTMAVQSFVRASPGTTTGGIHLILEQGALVTGTVTNALTGEPIRSMGVAAVNGEKGGTRPAGYVRTDDEGRYAMRLPGGSSKLYLCELLPEYTYARERTQRIVVIAEGATVMEGIDFTLMPKEKPGSFTFGLARGRVLDDRGAAAIGVPVCSFVLFDPEEPHLAGIFQRGTATDAHGSYELLVPADREVHIRAGGKQYSHY